MTIPWGRAARILTIAGALILAAAPARAETFDFYIFTYCPSTDPLCGFASQDEHQLHMLDAVQYMNLEWEVVGISFRPVVFNIQVDDYYGVTSACDGDVSQEIKDRREEWRANVAATFPQAISAIITPGWRCCSHIPGTPFGHPEDDLFPKNYGIFCSPAGNPRRLGSVLAHEMGHHFCLVHTQTHQDPVTHGVPNHDGDGGRGISDTPDDPAPAESFDPDGPGGDVDEDGDPVNGHEWCSNTSLSGLTDDGSPYDTLCQPACFLHDNDVTTGTSYQPLSNIAMSYYEPKCHGPYVVNGAVSYAFSPNQINMVRAICTPQVPERAALPDVCASWGGDTDHDGICQFHDNCQNEKNTSQADTDGDGEADACDLCPDDPNPTGDLDGDGVGDLCDTDKDGDTCDDSVDENPWDGHVRIGFRFNSSCGFGTEPILASAAIDSDGDGFKGCVDVDNDNDGICDGPMAQDPNAWGAPPGGCAAGPDPCTEASNLACLIVEGSPTLCPPYWFDCVGGSCVDFFLRIVSVINPADQITLDRFFQMSNRRIYAAPLAGKTLGQMGRALVGDFAGAGSPASPPDSAPAVAASLVGAVRLELWSRKSNQLVAIIGEFDPSRVSLGDLRRGRLLEITPTVDAAGNAQLAVAAVYGVPADGSADTDGDGRPDIGDNCLVAANVLQADADGDGFGNVCDPDIDGDLLVTDIDVAAVQGCAGADLTYEIGIAEPGIDEGAFPPDPVLVALALRCRAMDLNDDRAVNALDEQIAFAAIGLPPGPASAAASSNGCVPADCNDGDPCTHDYCDSTSNECRHVDRTCDDGNACTSDSCNPSTGACQAIPIRCSDGNICTIDSCDPSEGCRFTPGNDGQACNDLDACTLNTTCQAGVCGGGTPVSCDDGNVCTADACDPATGSCVIHPSPSGCDDANPCTSDACIPGPAGNVCGHTTLPNGATCSDGDLCTSGDACNGGVCRSDPVTCEDGDLCTVDLCDPQSGQCANAPVSCADGDLCTLDSCDPATGACAHDPAGFAQAISIDPVGLHGLEWTAPRLAAGWNVYRGTIPSDLMARRPGIYDHLCYERADFLGDGNRSLDPGIPEPGEAYYYVLTERSDCGEGPPGFDSAGSARPLPSPCIVP